MSCTVRVSSKNQIVIPREAREKAGIRPGQELLVLCKADRIVLMPKPEDFVAATRGLHSEVWQGVDVEAHVQEEREAWEQPERPGKGRSS